MVVETRFLAATVFFLRFWASLLTVFKSFLPFGKFFTSKTSLFDAQAVWQIRRWPKTVWWSAATSWRLSAAITTAASAGDLSDMVISTKLPKPPLEANTPPSHYLGFGRRLRKCSKLSYCTPYISSLLLGMQLVCERQNLITVIFLATQRSCLSP
jgi:hypothetical protein